MRVPPDYTLRAWLHTTAQTCFCGPEQAALPETDLSRHSSGCLTWDWALENRKITYQARMTQLDMYAAGLGDTDASQSA